MNRKLKGLGLMFVALLTLAGFSSSATATEFHSETAHTIIIGERFAGATNVFTVNAGNITCKETSYSGTSTSVTTSELTVTPLYKGCTAFGFVETTFDVPSGCDFKFTPITALSELHITCGKEEHLTVTAFNCWITIGSQAVNAGLNYSNGGASGWTRDFVVGGEVSGLTYTQHSKSFPGCTNGTFTNGKYSGPMTISGRDTEGRQVGIWHE